MILRRNGDGVIAISQPAHAWLSGQMARAWGGGEFFEVPEAVCLAAEQHDVGFLDWEWAPTLNAETGLPHTFLEMPRPIHLEIWSRGIRQMTGFGRYPAMLVSRHYLWLLDRSEHSYPAEEQAQIDGFRAEQGRLQAELEGSLREEAWFRGVSAEQIKRDQQLVSTWDWVSLLLCHGFAEAQTVGQIPSRNGMATVRFTPREKDAVIEVTPWPFRTEGLRLVCEGKVLEGRFGDEKAMREALRKARVVSVVMQLVPRSEQE